MLRGIAVLLTCQLVGEAIVAATGVTVPGPVIGMLLLFTWLQVRRVDITAGASGDPGLAGGTLRAADVLLRHMQLLFVPPAVGIVAYLGTLRADALPVSVALVGSWALGLAVVALLAALFDRARVEAAGPVGPAAGEGA
ncbi:CidA/LrgA family protein [Nocardioides sp. TRM66260-LWL]|uniref:CidA/LrgA family protein n=1 Tax=Nocardioides sp. TRM66260-LWL TaxID=2874478 RepID=UPI001CC3D428|nr:CidA/LrgA family protein [Nocardioides sp. TRM66260-LWL]MBZ5735253.1 CidA/LrgA family protein [Nocardioides sp. TRM66260-LWL]